MRFSCAALCVAAAVASSTLPEVRAERIEALSFQPPFNIIGADGKRMINDTWTYGGTAEAKKHFIRLTTDRQSKRGHVWNTHKVARETMSLILTFRISGQGKRWFGDGIGLWLTNHQSYVQGPNHGFTDNFNGVGIVIDTFKNSDHKGGHKDVTVQVNDGKKTIDMLNDETKVGCDAAMRYHEKSAIFDPNYSMSRVKVAVKGTKLTVTVDPESNGQWKDCAEVTLPFSTNWLSATTIGVTGATGGLADNHDVIRVDTFSDVDDQGLITHDTDVILHSSTKDYHKWLDSPNCGPDCVLAVLQKELQKFRVNAEHQYTDLKEKTENNVARLQKQELDNERRVAEVEAKLREKIDSTFDEKHRDLGDEVDFKITKELTANANAASGWKTPFFILVLGLGAGAFAVYRKYVAFMKSHLL